jgi:serine/threonine protein kinase
LQQEKTLSGLGVFRLIEDVLSALEAVHTLDYLYRDLKPDTLFYCLDNRTLLFNFSTALALRRRKDQTTTFFSLGYSPIEYYLTDSNRYGPWSDIYAFGAVLYHCVTGAAPIESCARVRDDPLRPAEIVAKGCYPPALLRWIDRSMAVRPDQRFQSIAQMRAALSAG